MTLDQHIRLVIGDLTVRIAALAAENDALKEQLAQAQTKERDVIVSRAENGQGPD